MLFAERRKARNLYLACFAAGLGYLTRPNGFLLMASLWGVLLASEIQWLVRARGWRNLEWERLRATAVRFAIAGLIFVATTAPSRAPRLAYGAQLVFVLLFSAILLEGAWDLTLRALRRTGTGGEPGDAPAR